MSLFGYVKKTRPAPWVACLKNGQPPVVPKIDYDALRRARRIQRHKRRKNAPERKLDTMARILRRAQMREYRIQSRVFLQGLRAEGALCPVWLRIPELRNARRYGWPTSGKITETHHRYGRLGPLLNWKPGWLGVSKLGHRWIHTHIAEARLHGWIAQKGDWCNLDVILRK